MVAINTPERCAEDQLSNVKLTTKFDTRSAEPVEFLETVFRLTHDDEPVATGGPTAQDIECLRQAAWKYERQTAMPVASGQDLLEVLDKLGYV